MLYPLRVALALIALLLPAAWASEPAPRPGHAAIASAHHLATKAGFEVLEAGGNAFDAAVAVSAALAVVEPASSGIGGGGFWLLRDASTGRAVMVDGRETAPMAAHRDLYLDAERRVNRDLAINGPLAAGIPGAAAAWVHISRRYGRLPLQQVLAPAIRLANNGFAADDKYVALLRGRAGVMKRWPETAAIFMPDGEVPEPGRIIRQQALAEVLERVARDGHDGFYSGETARRLVAGVRAAGGIWTLDDLAGYRVVEREPIVIDHAGYRLITAPPPSSGGIAIAEVLNLIEPYDWRNMARVDRVHLLAEAMRRAYRDRALYLGDPDFVQIPVSMLLDPAYAAGMRTTLRMDRALPSAHLAANPDRLRESDNTTHFSLIDRDGNMVSATLTINLPYGAAFVPPGTGVLLNNEMDDFSAKAGEPNAFGLIGFEANAIEPGKRMLSSMSPTIVLGPDRVAILGTPGGSRIISMVLIGILDFLEGHGPDSWVSRPRFHHQYLPDEISIEEGALDEAEIAALQARGHRISTRRRWGNMHAVLWDRITNRLEAASDPRWSSGSAEVR
ncbi:MAG: gamma-glutamyltransferase [Wenzhouxiangellaceae bacterium]